MAVQNIWTAVYSLLICSDLLITSSTLQTNQTNPEFSNSPELLENSHVLLTDTDPSFTTDNNDREVIAVNQNNNGLQIQRITQHLSQTRDLASDGLNGSSDVKPISRIISIQTDPKLNPNINSKDNQKSIKPLIKFEKSDNDSIKEFIHISNKFSIKLYAFMSKVYPNFIFSPISVSIMLTLLLRASSGHSYNEIYNTLELNKSNLNLTNAENCVEHVLDYFKQSFNSKSGLELELSNGICVRDGTKIITNFLRDSNRYFGAKVKAINFRSGHKRTDSKIAKWIESNTKSRLLRDRISLEPFKADTNIVIFNGLYLSAIPECFQNSLLIKSDFYVLGSDSIRTQFIQRAETLNITNSKLFKSSILEIPFISDNNQKPLALIIVLPNNNHSLESVEKEIFVKTDLFFNEISNMSSHLVNVMIPQEFIRSQSWRLDRILPHIGIKSVFQSETSLLTKISAFETMYINRVYHESYFDSKRLNNDIFHASDNIQTKGNHKQVVIESDFIANRPFLYLIIEKNSSALILMGRISII